MASKNSFFCKCHEPTLQNPAQAEFWDKTPYICGTGLCFCRLCNFDLPNKQRFSLQRHKSLFGCAEFLDSLLLVVAQSFDFAVFATLICQINSVFPCKDTKRYSAVPNSWIVCFACSTELGFVPQSLGLWHRALVVAQSFGCGTELWLWHRAWVVAQSFAFAVFATLICQINSVFPCKDTKALFGCVLVNIWKPVEITAA